MSSLNFYKEKSDNHGAMLLFVSFCFLMVFEGAIRKWIAPGISVPIQILRDILPSLALLVYIKKHGMSKDMRKMFPSNMVVLTFACYAFVSLLTVTISGQSSLAIALLGLRTHFAYVPLCLLVPILLNGQKFNEFLYAWSKVSILVCILALFQSTQPQDSWINIYASGDSSIATYGENGLVRASGTFSYLTGLGYFVQASAVVAFYLMFNVVERKKKIVIAFSFGLALAACFATGSRSTTFGTMLQLALLIMLVPKFRVLSLKNFLAIVFILIIMFVILVVFAQDQIAAFFERARESSGDAGWRLTDAFTEWLYVIETSPFGSGIGMGHQKAATLIGGVGEFGGYNSLPESELSRIAFELGLLGFGLYLLFRIACYLYAFRMFVKERPNQGIVALGMTILAFLAIGGMYTPIANSLFWMALGIITLSRNNIIQNRILRAQSSIGAI